MRKSTRFLEWLDIGLAHEHGVNVQISGQCLETAPLGSIATDREVCVGVGHRFEEILEAILRGELAGVELLRPVRSPLESVLY